MPRARAATHSRSSPLLLFPCNGNAIEALDCLGKAFRCLGFVDDAAENRGIVRCGYPVFGRAALAANADACVLAVPGGPRSYRSRRSVIDGLGIEQSRFATVIHPSARVSPLATIGHNVLVMAGVVITSNAVIGNHVCVLPNTVIHHDVRIGPWTLIGSNVTLAGGVAVGDNCYIASGTSVKNDVRIGEGALVGLGSNVICDIAAESVVAGNPARPVRQEHTRPR